MSGLGERFPEFQAAGHQVAPNEIDRYEQYQIIHPSIGTEWFGTAASGTQTQAKAYVVINKIADYPRNLLYSVTGTADMGGTWTVNGKNQFGEEITETVGSGTAAAGTPSFAIAGTKIFAEVTSGTFTVASGAVGGGLGAVGAAIGTAATAKFWFGLPTKIASTLDVKNIAWVKENVMTTLNGGTIGGFVSTTTHAISGSSIMAGTEVYSVLFKPSYSNLSKEKMAKL